MGCKKPRIPWTNRGIERKFGKNAEWTCHCGQTYHVYILRDDFKVWRVGPA